MILWNAKGGVLIRKFKAMLAFATGVLVCLAVYANAWAADSEAGVNIPSHKAVRRIEIFTEKFGFAVNFNDTAINGGSNRILNRIESFQIIKAERNNAGEWVPAVLARFDKTFWSAMPDLETFGNKLTLFYEPAAQIRAKVMKTELSEVKPEGAEAYLRVVYGAAEDGFRVTEHVCYSAELTREETDWFTEMALQIIGLPRDYDLDSLFNGSALKIEIPLSVKAEHDEENSFYYYYCVGGEVQKFGDGLFAYSVFNSGTVSVWTEDGKTYLDMIIEDKNRKTADIFMEVDSSVLEDIEEIVNYNEALVWDRAVLNTETDRVNYFALESVGAEDIIQAYVYGETPDGYQAFHESIIAYLMELAEGKPAHIPPPEELGNIFIRDGDFQINMSVNGYNGNFPEVANVYVSKMVPGSEEEARFFNTEAGYFNISENDYYGFDFNNAAAAQLLERILSLEYTEENKPSNKTETVTGMVSVRYSMGEDIIDHYLETVLPDGEREWVVSKLAEVLRLTGGLEGIFK